MRIGGHQKARLKHHLKARLREGLPVGEQRQIQSNDELNYFGSERQHLHIYIYIYVYTYIMDSLYFTLHPQFPGFRFEKPVFYEVSPYHGLFWDVGRSLSWIGRPHCLAVSIGQFANRCTQVFSKGATFNENLTLCIKTLTALISWHNILLHILTCFRTFCSRCYEHDHVQTIKGFLVIQP